MAQKFCFALFASLLFAEEALPERGAAILEAKAPAFQILTKNQALLKSFRRRFKKKPPSEKEIIEFLLDKGYYRARLVKSGAVYNIESPVQIIFASKGNRFFSEKEIRKLIKIDESKMGDFFYGFVEKAIQSAYQSHGFLKAEIKKSSHRSGWKERIYLNISEGPRARIAELKVKGLLSVPPEKYESFIKNASSRLIRRGFYSKKDLEAGYKNLISHLKNKGYLQSKIYSDRVFFKGDKAFIAVRLEEGPRILIRDIQIQGASALPVWKILSHIKSKIQSPLEIDLVREDLKRIERLYKGKGYLNMKIANKKDVIQYRPGAKYASLVVSIEEGPQAFVSNISFKGLKRAKERMARDLLKFKEGDILTPKKKERSIIALGATGLWTDISFSEAEGDSGFDVEALLKERKPRSIRGGLGLNDQRGWTARAFLEPAHRNLFGWGRALIARGSGQVSFGQESPFFEYEASGRYKEVFIPKYGFQGNVSLSQSRNVFNYSKDNINFVNKTQLSFFINKDIGEDLRARWNVWSFENRREDCPQAVCPENLQQIGSAGFNMAWDKRDNIFDPTKGFLSSFQMEWSSPFLGSSEDISFIKTELKNQAYWTFARDCVLGLRLEGGLISATGDGRHIPVSRAFILGGQSSLRGYDGNIEGDRIPRAAKAPMETANEALRFQKGDLRGNVLFSYYGLANMNFRFPVFEGFKAVLFYDWGGVQLRGPREEDLKEKERPAGPIQSLFDYGHSAGLGFRYQTFLAPIGLDLAFKLPPKEGDDYRLHFSIGW